MVRNTITSYHTFVIKLLTCLILLTDTKVNTLREAEVTLASDNCGYSDNYLCVKNTDTSRAGPCQVSKVLAKTVDLSLKLYH